MSANATSVGLDVHARSVVACGLDGRSGELFERRLTPDHGDIESWIRSLPGPVSVTYEAGPTGFGLARHLIGQGIECVVAAPSRLQRPSGDRVKTDVRDARHLARLLHLGEIVAVTVPGVEQEAARDLVRAREDVRGDLMSARHRLSKLLLRQGIVYYQGKPWTGVHDRWLRSQHFTLPGLQLAFDIAYDTLLATVARRDRLDEAITVMAGGSEFTPVVARLGCLRGVATLTAFGLAVEIGDWHRLDGRSIGAVPGVGAHRVLLGRHPITGVDHQDRQRARPAVVDRGVVASPHPLPGRGRSAPPPGPRHPGRTRPRTTSQPAPAPPLGGLRCPPQAGRGGQHRDRPRAHRLVLVTGRPGLMRLPLPPSLIVSRCSSVSTSFVLAALRALHVDTSHAARTGRRDGGRGDHDARMNTPERVEPPGRVDRIIGSARAVFEQRFCDRILARLDPASVAALEALVVEGAALPSSSGRVLLAELKADPGPVGLETLLREVDKLAAVRALGLPAGLFADASEKLVEAWRARAVRSYPSDLRAAPRPVRLTLLAALCALRCSEITDALVELLIGLIHRINARADRRVERELTEDLRRVRGKEAILFRLAEAAVDHPDDTVRTALFPVVGGKTLRELVREAKANEHAFQARVRTVLRGSYSNHYRRMLPPLLAALEFGCHNTAYRPVMAALALLARYAGVDGKTRFFADTDTVPIDGVVPRAWREAVVDDRGRVERIPYELCVLVALRDALRRREIYVRGAHRWRDPDEDLPGDFDTTREVRYAAIRQPTDPTAFITDLRARMTTALAALDSALVDGAAGGVAITTPSRRAVDQHPQAAGATGAGTTGRGEGRGDPPLGHPGPARRGQGRRVPHRVQHRVRLGRLAGSDRPRHPAPQAAAVPVRAGHQHGHQGDRGHRRARRDRGRAAPRPAPLHHPRQPAPRDHPAGQRHVRRAGPELVGPGHRLRVGLEEVRFLGVEPDDRVAPALRRPRCDDLLARRAAQRVHLLPAQELLLLRGRGHDRGPAAALHRHRHRGQLRRHPWGQRGRVRLHRAARVPAAAAAQEHRLDPALPPR